jgi:hypothetical protein
MPRPHPVVLLRPTSARSVRTALLELAYSLAGAPGKGAGDLVLVDGSITHRRLKEEWEQARAVLRPEVAGRLQVWAVRGAAAERLNGEADAKVRARVLEVAAAERRTGRARARRDAEFAIFKILLNHWFAGEVPITTEALARRAGFSYPSVAKVLRQWGTILERTSDRRLGFSGFPREEFERMRALSDRARTTARFVERGRGAGRSPEAQRARLEKLRPAGVALGGVAGALRLCPDLDVTGAPRLDLSVHAPSGRADLTFVAELDPGLAPLQDPHAPASLVVHAVPHADPLFEATGAGALPWADPVECLLDLHEAKLEAQALQFLEFLTLRRAALARGAR